MNAHKYGRWAWRAAMAVIVIVLAAGIFKLLDLKSFFDSMQTWELVPEYLVWPVVIITPLCEVSLGLFWLRGAHQRTVAALTLAMLAVFSSVYLAHLIWVGPPECACFGLMRQFVKMRDHAASVLARNAILAIGLLPFLCLRKPTGE